MSTNVNKGGGPRIRLCSPKSIVVDPTPLDKRRLLANVRSAFGLHHHLASLPDLLANYDQSARNDPCARESLKERALMRLRNALADFRRLSLVGTEVVSEMEQSGLIAEAIEALAGSKRARIPDAVSAALDGTQDGKVRNVLKSLNLDDIDLSSWLPYVADEKVSAILQKDGIRVSFREKLLTIPKIQYYSPMERLLLKDKTNVMSAARPPRPILGVAHTNIDGNHPTTELGATEIWMLSAKLGELIIVDDIRLVEEFGLGSTRGEADPVSWVFVGLLLLGIVSSLVGTVTIFLACPGLGGSDPELCEVGRWLMIIGVVLLVGSYQVLECIEFGCRTTDVIKTGIETMYGVRALIEL